jgi:hypothetical protein
MRIVLDTQKNVYLSIVETLCPSKEAKCRQDLGLNPQGNVEFFHNVVHAEGNPCYSP